MGDLFGKQRVGIFVVAYNAEATLSAVLDRIPENVAQEGLLLQPHLNTALRAEILYFTTQGIMFSAQNVDPYLPLNEHGHFIPFAEYEKIISPVCFSFDDDNDNNEKIAIKFSTESPLTLITTKVSEEFNF
jgi:hypothetical protein